MADSPRDPIVRKRTRIIHWALWSVVVALLVGEIATRTVTYIQWKAPLLENPDLARRMAAAEHTSNALTPQKLLDGPARFPAPIFSKGERDAAPQFTTFEEFPAEAFRSPPKTEQPTPGVVRIAFVGGSTTFGGYPEEVAALMDERFGDGRVEVVNMGVPASRTATTLVLMRRFLPKWQPHLVVQYAGFNDIYAGRALVLAQRQLLEEAEGSERPLMELPPKSRGLWSLLTGSGSPSPPDLDPIFEEGIWGHPLERYWAMSRMAWSHGFELYVSTFASPDYANLSPDEREQLELNIRYLWPLLIGTDEYAADLAEYNRRVRRFAEASETRLIDVAGGIQAGLDLFDDHCHLKREGRQRHAKIVFDALAPRVEALLAEGAPPISPRPPPPDAPALTAPSEGLPTTHPLDGSCEQGPCPDGACFVPGGPSHSGYPMEIIEERVFPYLKSGIGFVDPSWYQDDGPPVQATVSPFCIDRTEATFAAAERCRAEGACPPYRAPDDADPETTPAVFPRGSDAARFCAWRGGRLPTEAEWDAAARGPKGLTMPWGDSAWTGKEANYCGRDCRFGSDEHPGDGFPTAAPVGSFPTTSPYGPVDMAGNLWEWMGDCFQDGKQAMVEGKQDPIVRTTPCRPFLHGGSFTSYPGILERRNAEGLADVLVESRGVRCAYDFGTVHTPVP